MEAGLKELVQHNYGQEYKYQLQTKTIVRTILKHLRFMIVFLMQEMKMDPAFTINVNKGVRC